MTFRRLLVLVDSHPPLIMATHLASSGALAVESGTSNHIPDLDGTAGARASMTETQGVS